MVTKAKSYLKAKRCGRQREEKWYSHWSCNTVITHWSCNTVTSMSLDLYNLNTCTLDTQTKSRHGSYRCMAETDKQTAGDASIMTRKSEQWSSWRYFLETIFNMLLGWVVLVCLVSQYMLSFLWQASKNGHDTQQIFHKAHSCRLLLSD